MPLRTLEIDYDEEQPERAHAAFIARLAYPHEQEEEAAREFVTALLAGFYRQRAVDPRWRWSKQRLEPGFLLTDPEWLKRTVTAGDDIIESYRFAAAETAWPILADEMLTASGGLITGLRLGDKRPSVKAGIAWVENSRKGNRQKLAASNLMHRAWADSKSVLHVAIVYLSIRRSRAKAFPSTSMCDMVGGEWLRGAVDMAEALRQQIGASSRFPNVAVSEMTRIVLR